MGRLIARLRGIVAAEDRRAVRRRRALRLVGVAVVVAFAALATRRVDPGAVAAALAGGDPAFVLLACLANLSSLAVHSKRWAALLRAPAPIPFRDAFAAVCGGYAVGIVVPARAGDLVRSWILARRTGVSTAAVVAAAGLDYVVGAAALVPLVALVGLASPLPAWARSAMLVLGAGTTAAFAVAFLLRPRGDAPARAGGHGLVGRLRAGLAATRDPVALGASAGWAVLGWTAELAIALFALEALGLPRTLEAAALAVLAATAANVVAVSPGNTGPFELAVVLALGGLGVPRAPALAFALLYHLVHLVPVGLVGIVALVQEARAERAPVRDAVPGP